MRQRQNLTSCSLDEQSCSLDERDDEQSLHGEARRGVFAHLELPRGNCQPAKPRSLIYATVTRTLLLS